MELAIEKGLNDIGIGARGPAGGSSVMGVHVETSARHPSPVGVGVSVGCWAHRRGTLHVNPDLSYEILSHKGVTL
jgi:L(+)-tartrate dehydratase alpha subunit